VARDPIPTWCFAIVVVRRADRFLLVHERKHGQLWYLPGGRAEFGETLEAAACRETLEETGIAIRLTGVIRIEHSLIVGGARLRALFTGEPIDDRPPKSVPDEESLGAEWVSLDELHRHPPRSPEVEQLIRYVAGGAPVSPMHVLAHEGAPYDA
jgi:8-oxo-dGTP pyrophosphatase MutT (NUDIX family)